MIMSDALRFCVCNLLFAAYAFSTAPVYPEGSNEKISFFFEHQ